MTGWEVSTAEAADFYWLEIKTEKKKHEKEKKIDISNTWISMNLWMNKEVILKLNVLYC